MMPLDYEAATHASAMELAAEARVDETRRRWVERGGGLCHLCGSSFLGEGVCPHHSAAYSEGWAESNRTWCAFFHRGVVAQRPIIEWWYDESAL